MTEATPGDQFDPVANEERHQFWLTQPEDRLAWAERYFATFGYWPYDGNWPPPADPTPPAHGTAEELLALVEEQMSKLDEVYGPGRDVTAQAIVADILARWVLAPIVPIYTTED